MPQMSCQLVINKKMMRYSISLSLFFFYSFPSSGVMLEIMKNLHIEDRYKLWLTAYSSSSNSNGGREDVPILILGICRCHLTYQQRNL